MTITLSPFYSLNILKSKVTKVQDDDFFLFNVYSPVNAHNSVSIM